MKRLVSILGPVVAAGALLLGLLLLPWRQPTVSAKTVKQAGVSLSENVLVGARLKQAGVAAGAVPVLGSSELSRMDSFHPSVLAARYHQPMPFLLGAPGTQSLTHFLALQPIIKQLRGKRLVMVVSPQWFVPGGQRKAAFAAYFSPLGMYTWLLQAKPSAADQYAARRFLRMPVVTGSHLLKTATTQVAAGQPLSPTTRAVLQTRLRLLRTEDDWFSRIRLPQHFQEVEQKAKLLPATYQPQLLDALAQQQGEAHTKSNPFGIADRFYRRRLTHGKLKLLKHAQAKFDYRQSVEYSDFQLLLALLAKNKVAVQFILPPVNERWAHYTDLSLPMVDQTVAKLKQQLASQGFTNVTDLSRRGSEPYFMEDTIHLGWRGWVAVNQAVRPFLMTNQAPVHYRINSGYFTKAWQQWRPQGPKD